MDAKVKSIGEAGDWGLDRGQIQSDTQFSNAHGLHVE